MSANSFGGRATLKTGGRSYEIFRLDALERLLHEDDARKSSSRKNKKGDKR